MRGAAMAHTFSNVTYSRHPVGLLDRRLRRLLLTALVLLLEMPSPSSPASRLRARRILPILLILAGRS